MTRQARVLGWMSAIVLANLCAFFSPPSAAAEGLTFHPGVLGVCADPDNLPFSDRQGQGFENKLAALIAKRLGVELHYSWYSEVRGGVSMPLSNGTCDIVMGYAEGSQMIDDTNPYYYTSYALFYRKDDKALQGVTRLSDPRLRHKRIGVFASTPATALLGTNGIAGTAVPFQTSVETGTSGAAKKIFKQLDEGKLDAAILWGPIGGYYAQSSSVPLITVPLVNEQAGPAMVYGITMGIRPNEPQWKHRLNKIIANNQDEIYAILERYHVPLLKSDGTPVKTVASAGH